jgi:hypothetical protein
MKQGLLSIALAATALLSAAAPVAAAAAKQPNIVVIMGDDIGMWNIGAYHRGMMAGRTPNLDKIAKEGMLFTDYYAEASCTAGRAPPASSARITWATRMSSCPRSMVSTNSSATSITSTRWKTRRIPTIRRIS